MLKLELSKRYIYIYIYRQNFVIERTIYVIYQLNHKHFRILLFC